MSQENPTRFAKAKLWFRRNAILLAGLVCAAGIAAYGGDKLAIRVFGSRIDYEIVSGAGGLPVNQYQYYFPIGSDYPQFPALGLTGTILVIAAAVLLLLRGFFSPVSWLRSLILNLGEHQAPAVRKTAKRLLAFTAVLLVVVSAINLPRIWTSAHKYTKRNREQINMAVASRLNLAEKLSDLDFSPVKKSILTALWPSPEREVAAKELHYQVQQLSSKQPFLHFNSADEQLEFCRTIDLVDSIAAAADGKPRLIAELRFDGRTNFEAGTAPDIAITLAATSRVPRAGDYLLQSNELYLAKMGLQAPSFVPPTAVGLDLPRRFAATNPVTWKYSLTPIDKHLGEQTIIADIYVKRQNETNGFEHGSDLTVKIQVTDGLFPPFVSNWVVPSVAAVALIIVTAIVGKFFGKKKDDPPPSGPVVVVVKTNPAPEAKPKRIDALGSRPAEEPPDPSRN